MNLRLFTIVFAEPFLTFFEQGCARSLAWPKNRAALNAVQEWDIWTTEEDKPRLEEIVGPMGIPVQWHFGMHHRGKHDNTLADALLAEFQIAMDSGAKFLFASPDSVFGDGTIPSLLEVGTVPGLCVSFTPMRVKAEGFAEAMGPGPLSNAQLVRLAFERAHPGFAGGDASQPSTNSFRSGVSWRRIGEGLYAVTSRLPSAYLMQPTKGDLKWFRAKPKFGHYDHAFGHRLVEEQRQRVIGSSDAAFVAEMTSAHRDAPNLEPSEPKEPDRYFQNMPHYQINRNTVCIWRAE